MKSETDTNAASGPNCQRRLVRRFDAWGDVLPADMEEEPDGDWVRHEDYEKIETALRELAVAARAQAIRTGAESIGLRVKRQNAEKLLGLIPPNAEHTHGPESHNQPKP